MDQAYGYGDAWKEYAILLRTDLSAGEHRLNSIVIQSPLLKMKVNALLGEYPSFYIGEGKDAVIEKPFIPFVHCWESFISACENETETATQDHMKILRAALEPELRETFSIIEKFKVHGMIRFDQLWMIFPPGSFVFSERNGIERIYKLRRTELRKETMFTSKYFLLHSYYIDWDGSMFGYALDILGIETFEGSKKFTDLGIYPLDVHAEKAAVIERLVARGRRFAAYTGVHYLAYDGLAVTFFLRLPRNLNADFPLQVSGRVVLDTTIFNANKKSAEMEQTKLTEDLLMICSSTARGYSLDLKQWMHFRIDSLKEIEWNVNAFKSLALPGNHKELLLAFAQTQGDSAAQFDDVIEGKGKGMVVLLEGPPGLGKTLTVEALAEKMKIPIYRIASGQMRPNPDIIKSVLQDAFLMTKAWKGIILLDEADIFLERRSVNDLDRNQLVSVFLQHLEYFEGTIFLTTNRVDCIDPAFESRIHLSLSYPELTQELRHKIWKNFMRTMKVDTSQVTDGDLERFAALDMNGRQIKNTVKMAGLLATKANHSLTAEHVGMMLAISQSKFK
ncbi:P-loop containing nucleoside triphosphate hydrolase protein [Leptodontidium sp. 2 PMI_412]|nr:P-loop containing nucleoside triphosphate hydrolase protein [Leptodontidium sp. 2 PMI_412]